MFLYLILFYQNNWFSFLFSGPALRQFVLLRWVTFFRLLFGIYSVWCRLLIFIYSWLPALSFYTLRYVFVEAPLVWYNLDTLLLPTPSTCPTAPKRIFGWTRRYLIFFFWFFSFIYKVPLNYNFRIITFPFTTSSRLAVWTFLWL